MSDEQYQVHRFARNLARRLAKLERANRKTARASGDLRHSAIDGGQGLTLKDADGNVAYRLGTDANGVTAPEYVDGPVPAQPAAPFVDAGQRVVKVQLSGLDADEGPAPTDFWRAEIHVSLDDDFGPSLSTLATYIDEPNGSATHSLPAGEWYVGVVWVTLSKQRSVMSQLVVADIEPPVDAEDMERVLDEAKDLIEAAAEQAQRDFQELKDRLDNFEEFDPTELEAELADIAQGLIDARKDAKDLFETLEDEVTPQALISKLVAQEAWIGGTLLKDDSVQAKHITASESLSAKIAEFLKLSVVDLVAGSGQIDDAVIQQLWVDGLVARSATMARAIIAAPNLLPAPDADDASEFWSPISRNTNHPSVWIQGRYTRRSTGTVRLDAGEEYRFKTAVAASVADTRYYVQLVGTGSTPNLYIASNQVAGASQDDWADFEITFTVAETGDYHINIYANHNNGVVGEDNYQWFRTPRIERMLDGRLTVPGSIDVGSLNVTEEMVASFARILHLVVDQMDVNSIWADTTWQQAGHFGSQDGNYQTRVDGTGLQYILNDTQNDTETVMLRLGALFGLIFADEDGEITGSLSQDGDASLKNVAVEALSHGGRPLQDPDCQDYVHPSGNQSLISWRPRAVVGRGQVTLPNNINTPYREYGFMEVAAHLEKGRSYWLTITPFLARNANANANYLRIRATTDGAHPTMTSQTIMDIRNVHGGNQGDIQMQGSVLFTPTVTGIHRFMASIYTYTGVQLTFAGQQVQLIIEDAGATVPDGTVVRASYGSHPDGTSDVLGPIQSADSVTTEWHAQWYQNYSNNGTTKQTSNTSTGGYGSGSPTQGRRTNRPEQGRWSSIMGFDKGTNDETLQETLVGATIHSITLEAQGQGSFNDANTFRASFYAQPQPTAPSQFTSTALGIPLFDGSSQLFNVGQTRRINIPVDEFGPLLKSGDFQAIGLFTTSDQVAYAGRLSWNKNRIKLIISYTQN